MADTHPDCIFKISQLAPVTEDRFDKDKSYLICRLNNSTRYDINNHVELKIHAFDQSSLKVVDFSVSSYANNYDLSTQLSHICFMEE